MDQASKPFALSDLVFTSHDDVFGFWHHAALLGHQRVPFWPWQPVGSEQAIVLLHTHGSPSQLTSGVVHRQGTPSDKHVWLLSLLFLPTNLFSSSHFTVTYESSRVLYSRTPEMRCAANLENKENFQKLPNQTEKWHDYSFAHPLNAE